MSADLREQIYGNLNQKGTDELMEIWQSNNHIEWTEMVFDVIREILQERHIELPPQGEPITEISEANKVETEVTTMSLAQVYFSFKGRIGLVTYWLKGVLPLLVLTIIVGVIEGVTPADSAYSGIPTILWRLLVI